MSRSRANSTSCGHELEVDARGRGVVRERRDDHARTRPRLLVRAVQVLEEVLVGTHAHVVHARAREDRSPDVDRVRRRRHERGVARTDEREHQVREAFLRTDGGTDLGLEVERHAELALVQRGDGFAQLRDALARRVAMVARVAHRLDQLLDRDVGRRQIGVAEREVDDVLAGSPQRHLQRIDLRERVRRQSVDPSELHDDQRYQPGRGPPIVLRRAETVSVPSEGRPARRRRRLLRPAARSHPRRVRAGRAHAAGRDPRSCALRGRARVPDRRDDARTTGRRSWRAYLDGYMTECGDARRRSARTCTSISTASSPMPRCGCASFPGSRDGTARARRHGRAARHHLQRRRSDRSAPGRAGDPAGRSGHRRPRRMRHRLRRGRRDETRPAHLPDRARRDGRSTRPTRGTSATCPASTWSAPAPPDCSRC